MAVPPSDPSGAATVAQPSPPKIQSTSPATVLARWPSANAQTVMSLLVRRLNGHTGGRRAVQIRPFRLPGNAAVGGPAATAVADKKKDVGRHLYVVRALSAVEHMTVFVEDPAAPKRSEVLSAGNGKGAAGVGEAAAQDSSEDKDTPSKPPHTRWSCCTVGGASQWSPLATPFDAFLQRVLLGGGPAAANSASASAAAWVPRSMAISIEGWIISSPGQGGVTADWDVKIGQVNIKGGAAAGTVKGVLIEATYNAVPYLPAGSTFVKDFVSSLIPSQALAVGEIQWITLDEERCLEAGLLPDPDPVTGVREWEWTEKHSALAYIQMFQSEGLL
ncbi:hypothetical protein T439DRAFT_320277 [Meredithblackwellia eburnea MCA 4105]